MRLFFLYSIFALFFAFAINSCETATQNQPLEDYGPQFMVVDGEQTDPPAGTISGDLIAGQHMVIGYVDVEIDGNTLNVTYTCDVEDWKLNEIHFHAAPSVDDIPATGKGNPKVGKFMTKYEDLDDYTYSFEVDITDLDYADGDVLYFAAHAAVSQVNEDGEEEEETAWREGTRFVQRGNWGMYFTNEDEDNDDD